MFFFYCGGGGRVFNSSESAIIFLSPGLAICLDSLNRLCNVGTLLECTTKTYSVEYMTMGKQQNQVLLSTYVPVSIRSRETVGSLKRINS